MLLRIIQNTLITFFLFSEMCIRDSCTTHYIRKSVLKELVLADLQRVTSYVKEHEQEFIETANAVSYTHLKAAASPHREDKTLLWFCRPSGTHCFRERDVFLKDTAPHNLSLIHI